MAPQVNDVYGVYVMNKEQHNLYVVEVDMKNKSVEDIAREAVLQIIGITDALIERQERAEEVQKEEQDG